MTAVSRTRSTDKRFYGVVEGVVTAVDDEKGKEGRVKVQFPWFDDHMETEWCRVRQFYAGNGYGAFFVPEVGDEVLVAFIHGDMRLPVILGGLYNGKDKPPSHRAKDKDEKLIRTKGGHEVLLNDTQNHREVWIKTAGNHTVHLDDQNKKITIQSSNGQSAVLDDTNSRITIQTSGGQSVTMEASGVTLKATKTTIESSVIELGSGASEPLILGNTFLTLFSTHTHPTAAPGPPSPPTPQPLLTNALSRVSKTG